MRRFRWIAAGAVILAIGLAGGCYRVPGKITRETPIVEGVLFRVQYQLDGDRTGGLTRENNMKSVPGGNGSWNVNAYGRLYANYLVITYPDSDGLGPHVIPAHRLIEVQFGDGNIQKVSRNPVR